MTIRLIGFDLDDTLFNATNLATESRIGGLKKIQQLGLQFNYEKGIKLLHSIVDEFGSNYSKHYDELLIRMKASPDEYGLQSTNFSIPKYVAAGVIGYHEVKVKEIRPFPEVPKILDQLKELGYVLILISDGIAVKQYEKLIRLNLLSYYSDCFISEEVGWKKPNPEFYRFCLKYLNIPANESMYIGDRVDHDIIPSQQIGMKTVLVHRGGKYDPYKDSYLSELQSVNPDYDVDSFNEIIPILNSL
ncbi:MAG: HAD-IA family hydrolase [Candidatus Lokiarchaeota archaeon]|nr:HAD-IA family hydrolase [Candidatus Lokiarchaeota archaeon]